MPTSTSVEPAATDAAEVPVVLDEDELRLDQLAVVHAALNPDSLKWQQDVIVTAAVELLASRDLTCEQITKALRQMWATTAISDVVVAESLESGREAGLVAPSTTLSGEERWQATDNARKDSEGDRAWARAKLEDFSAAVDQQLEERGLECGPAQRTKLVSATLQALAVAASGVYEVDDSDPEGLLRPVRFDLQRAHEWVRTQVEPRSVRDACLPLVDAAADPLDPFGNAVVHLLVVGNLLRGVMARHDVSGAPDLSNLRLLLDTSVLTDLVDDGSDAQQQLERAITLTNECGGQVVVAEHTLDEWERLWVAADQQRPEQADRMQLAAHTDVLAENPFVAAFYRQKQNDPKLRWARFQVGRRNIRTKLEDLGVVVRDAGNRRDADRDRVAAAKEALTKLNDKRKGKGNRKGPWHRGAAAIAADAESVAMILRWRARERSSALGAGYFCARDTMTNKACAPLREEGDTRPLVVSPAGWVMLMARLAVGDPEQRQGLVELVGSNVVRETFLSMATMYTAEDALRCAEVLREDGHLAPEDLRTVVQLELDDVLGSESTSLLVAEEAIRLRSARRDERARRAAEIAERERDRALTEQQELRSTLEKASQRHEAELRRQEVAVREEAEAAKSQTAHIERHHRVVVRSLVTALAVALVVGGFVIAGLVAGEAPDKQGYVVRTLVTLGVLIAGIDSARHPDLGRAAILGRIIRIGLGLVATVLLEIALVAVLR